MECANCKKPLSQSFNYCPYCGNLLGENITAFEDINLTFVRADLSGFTSLCEKMEPEEIMGFLNTLFGEFKDIIQHHKGLIYQVIGDEIVALFGLEKTGFSPHMAIIAVEEIFKKLKLSTAAHRLSRPIGLKVGMEMETASIYNIKGDFQEAVIVSDGFKKSLILQKNSGDNTILVGENLYQITKSFFEFTPFGEFVEDSYSVMAYKFTLK